MNQAKIDHIGVAVQSIDRALEFYRDALGIEPSGRVTVEAEKVHVAMLPAGEPRIELLEASEPGSAIARFIERRGEGMHHIALRVPDLDAAVRRLAERGLRLASDGIQAGGAEGYRYVFVHPKSAGGVLVELIEE